MVYMLTFETNPACFHRLYRYTALSFVIKAGCSVGNESGHFMGYRGSKSRVYSMYRLYHHTTPLVYHQVVRRKDNALQF